VAGNETAGCRQSGNCPHIGSGQDAVNFPAEKQAHAFQSDRRIWRLARDLLFLIAYEPTFGGGVVHGIQTMSVNQ
jgi:hypothetical protein